MFLRPAFLIASAGLAAAVSLSNSCTSALLAVAASPDATCLDFALLVPLAVSNTSTTSIIPSVNSWLTGMCAQGLCSNSTLQTVVTNITNGCSSDLASVGLPTDPNTLTPTVQVAYPTVRQIACLNDTSSNTLCATELLNDIQSSIGITLSINNIVNLITQVVSGANITIPQNVTCSNCSKAAYTIASTNFPSLLSKEQSVVQSECGSSFTDGQMPPSIQEATSNSTSSTGGAASLSVNSFNVGAAMLVAVSSAFTIFA
ncbi:hypothetical protein JVU11DRAFT_2337 [Chiua virens]|nr:hypothetical protein JVU11DRAFT_2337 [Chiua virens]